MEALTSPNMEAVKAIDPLIFRRAHVKCMPVLQIVSCHSIMKYNSEACAPLRGMQINTNDALTSVDLPQSNLGPFASHWLEDGGGEPNPPAGGDASAAAFGVTKHASTAATTTEATRSLCCDCVVALRPNMNALARSPSCRALTPPLGQAFAPPSSSLTDNYNIIPDDRQALRPHCTSELSCLTR